MVKELESVGISTQLCARRDAGGVPAAYVICAGTCFSNMLWVLNVDGLSVADGTKSVVNHNPIPDVLHDEFVRLLSPLLIPPPPSSGTEPDMSQAPFEWLHFEVSLLYVLPLFVHFHVVPLAPGLAVQY